MYKYYNPNPDRKIVDDCVIRAICKITGKDWERVTTMAMTGEDEDGNWENNSSGRTGYRRYSDSYSGGQRRNRDYPYGYSGSSKNMLDTLYDMLDDAESEDERMAIQRRINKMERHY